MKEEAKKGVECKVCTICIVNRKGTNNFWKPFSNYLKSISISEE